MYYLKAEDENGDYICTDGKRYALFRGTWVAQKDRWTWFDTEEECLDAWGLTFDPLPQPEPEPPYPQEQE